MKINKVLLEKCSIEDDDINFYNEIAEMLREDIAEYLVMINSITNIYNRVIFVNSLRKLLELILPVDNEYYVACKKINEIYNDESFNIVKYRYYLQVLNRFDVNEYI
uniref:Uncharacterized protein n=1 Tax=viral metagenome TaxID=1070528 RepID=A0A6C0DRS9_9ZZZZ